LTLEERFGQNLAEEMRKRGHKVEVRENYNPTAAPTIVIYDPLTKVIQAGADVRRGRYAIGW
jgi:gamma-glutamyltranspeptidase